MPTGRKGDKPQWGYVMHSQDAKLNGNGSHQTRITTRELAEAKDAVTLLLEELALPAYIFEVDPRNGLWEVRIDRAVDGNWQSLVFPIHIEELQQVITDQAARTRMLDQWRNLLCGTAN